jgi:hypothetical protein
VPSADQGVTSPLTVEQKRDPDSWLLGVMNEQSSKAYGD